MATIYTKDGDSVLTDELKGCTVCDDAIQTARKLAKHRGEAVMLEDDDGVWLVSPDGHLKKLEDGSVSGRFYPL